MSDEQQADDQPAALGDHGLVSREPVSAGQRPDTDVLIAVYQALVARQCDRLDLLWRVPAFVLTVETFIYAGIIVITPTLAIVVLSFLGFFTAVFGAMTMRRAQLASNIDEYLLDWYEGELLGSGQETFRLHHGMSLRERAESLKELPGAKHLEHDKPFDRFARTTWGGAVIWIMLLIAVGVGVPIIALGRLI
jgi:hypothetical protein